MKMVITKRAGRIHIDLHGLLDNQDGRILLSECERLVDQGHRHLIINLSKTSRISPRVFDTFETIQQLLGEQDVMCTFLAPKSRMTSELSGCQITLQPSDAKTEKELASELQFLG